MRTAMRRVPIHRIDTYPLTRLSTIRSISELLSADRRQSGLAHRKLQPSKRNIRVIGLDASPRLALRRGGETLVESQLGKRPTGIYVAHAMES